MTNLPEDPSQLSMLELFRLEVETQAIALDDRLLALENDSENNDETAEKALENLMRAAHSIKGAAKIVGLDGVVRLAHEMENCFVAVQKNQIALDSRSVDVLLGAVDWLTQLSQCSEQALPTWLNQQSEHLADLAATIATLSVSESPSINREDPGYKSPDSSEGSIGNLKSHDAPITTSVTTIAKPIVTPDPSPTPSNTDELQTQRVVRVNADNLNRLMALAGESLVEANWFQPFLSVMQRLKRQQQESIDRLQQLQQETELSPTVKQHLAEVYRRSRYAQLLLDDCAGNLERFSHRFSRLSEDLYREVIASHMRPFADGIHGFPRMVRDVAKELGKKVKLEIVGEGTQVDRDILERLEAPLTQMLRNAIVHGIEHPDRRRDRDKPEVGTIRLEATHRAGMLAISVSDDGSGIDLEKLRSSILEKQLANEDLIAQLNAAELLEFLFLPGFSTAEEVTEIAGRGVGLDIAKSMVQQVGGTLRATTEAGQGFSCHLQLPLTLSVIRALLVEISGEPYAFGLSHLDRVQMVRPEEILLSENRPYIVIDEENVSSIAAWQVLELPEPKEKSLEQFPTIILGDRGQRYGLIVDRFLGEQDLVVRPLDPRLGKIQDISAAAVTEDGLPLLIVDVADLLRSIERLVSENSLNLVNKQSTREQQKDGKRILVVDDSITVREMERKLLQNQGYQVDVAVDGMEGWNAVRIGNYDLVISDIDMPRTNGIEFVKLIKDHSHFKDIPVIIVSYKDRKEDQIAGLNAGANYYLTKSSFHDNSLIDAVNDLIG